MPTELTRDQLRRLARLGAARRLEELRQEEAAIRAAFPDLDDDTDGRGAGHKTGGASSGRKRRRPKMSAAQKRAVSERMKKYWAERRKAR